MKELNLEKLREILKNPTKRKIVEYLCLKGKGDFAEITRSIPTSKRVDYHVRFLFLERVLEKLGRGTYTVNTTILCMVRSILAIQKPLMIVGGIKDEMEYNLDVYSSLEPYGYKPDKITYFAPSETRKKLTGKIKKGVEFKTYPEEVLKNDLRKVSREVEEFILENLQNYELLIDLTSGTKPVIISLLQDSIKYNLKALYFSGRRVDWVNQPY